MLPPEADGRHFDNDGRGLLSDRPRKSAEPIALACGTAVRTPQEFLVTANRAQESARESRHAAVAQALDDRPDDPLGTIGVIDETSTAKKGDQTPGVQRQYLGGVGKIDNGLVTVRVGVAKGRFQALLDADPYRPESWAADRPRCRAAGIPDDVGYRPKWKLALDQVIRRPARGIRFDGLVCDEGYGSQVPFPDVLALVNQRFVGEVPVNFAVRTSTRAASRRADAVRTAADAERGRRFRLARRTVADAWWRAASRSVVVGERSYALVAAINASTAEVKYFTTNATTASLKRVLAVAFRRATIEHSSRVAKSEAGLTHYEGRHGLGLVRHLVLTLVVLGFASIHTDRLRGEKPAGDDGAGVPGDKRARRGGVPPAAGHSAGGGALRRSGTPAR